MIFGRKIKHNLGKEVSKFIVLQQKLKKIEKYIISFEKQKKESRKHYFEKCNKKLNRMFTKIL